MTFLLPFCFRYNGSQGGLVLLLVFKYLLYSVMPPQNNKGNLEQVLHLFDN